MNVYEATQARLRYCFQEFERVVVYFSGGKDSTVLLHMAQDIQTEFPDKELVVVFIDWEVQYSYTMRFVESMMSQVKQAMWFCVPLVTVNATSVFQPEWTCWDPECKDRWVREMPSQAITQLPDFQFPMTFEEFVPRLNHYLSSGQKTICLSGIRSEESLNHYRTMVSEKKHRYAGHHWTTQYEDSTVHGYPLIEWKVSDVWVYLTSFHKPYNPIYDLMYMAGVSPYQMRIDEPFGNEQKEGLWLYHIIEPETWSKMLNRVSGVNFGALYARGRGSVLGKQMPTLPEGVTWRGFVEGLLETLPQDTARHYRAKIGVYMGWCAKHQVDVPDAVDGDCGGKDVPSWRRVARAILRNDYWCVSLSFSPTKTAHYERYLSQVERLGVSYGK